MSTSRLVLFAALASSACSGSSKPAPVAPPIADDVPGPPEAVPEDPGPATPAAPPRQLAAETPITTAWAATLTVPASWWIAESNTVVTIQDPDREATLHFTTVEAADRPAAIAAAWQRIQPGFALA